MVGIDKVIAVLISGARLRSKKVIPNCEFYLSLRCLEIHANAGVMDGKISLLSR